MLEVRYLLDEEIYISGSSKEIEDFRLKVLEFLETPLKKIQIETDTTIIPDSYKFIATGLEIIKNYEAVRVSLLHDKIVRIEGSKENLEKFSSFLEFEENPIEGRHSHYEHYQGNEYITADSIPIIIGIK